MWGLIALGLCLPNVGNHAHAGGFVGGALVGWLCGPRWDDDATPLRARDARDKRRGRALNMYAPVRGGAPARVRPFVPLPIASAVVLIAVPLVRLGVWHAPRAIQLALAQPGLLSGRRLYR